MDGSKYLYLKRLENMKPTIERRERVEKDSVWLAASVYVCTRGC